MKIHKAVESPRTSTSVKKLLRFPMGTHEISKDRYVSLQRVIESLKIHSSWKSSHRILQSHHQEVRENENSKIHEGNYGMRMEIYGVQPSRYTESLRIAVSPWKAVETLKSKEWSPKVPESLRKPSKPRRNRNENSRPMFVCVSSNRIVPL